MLIEVTERCQKLEAWDGASVLWQQRSTSVSKVRRETPAAEARANTGRRRQQGCGDGTPLRRPS
jgi:hypothetical protein